MVLSYCLQRSWIAEPHYSFWRTSCLQWLCTVVAGLAVEKGREVALEGAPAVPLRKVDGHLIGEGNCCVYENGVMISVSRLGVSQLRAELAARGLRTGGLRNTLYRRVQARRG